MNVKVSVIIPIYKSEKYLPACVQSIVQQNYSNIELILIDDGSPDNCPLLCEKYAQEYNNVRVVHQKNRGVGYSRNIGMQVATGKYIFFVDSDDCLDGENVITTMVQKAEETNADIVIGNFRYLTDEGVFDVKFCSENEVALANTVDFRFKGFFLYGHLGFNWGKCYKKEFLKKFELTCTEVPFTEDKAMNLCCCACEPAYAFVSESVYLYRLNKESVTYRYRSNLAEIWINTAKHLEKFLDSRKIEEQYCDLIDFHICLGLFTIVQQEIQNGNKKISAIYKKLKEYAQDSFVKKCMKELAKGKYVNEIHSALWRILIQGISVVFVLHGYFFIALGFRLLHDTRLDKKIIGYKYKKEEN